MAIIGALFGLLGRFAGRLLNSTLGWATILLFGKVSGRSQTVLLAIALGSLVWVLTVAGIVVPDIATFLLTFVPLPGFVDQDTIRLAMLGLAVLIPLLIGVAAVGVADASTRARGLGLIRSVLRGYPFTFVLAVTIGILGVVSLARKLGSIAKRWNDAHVPVIVKPGGYDDVLGDLEHVLDDAGLEVVIKPAPAILSLPPRLLDAVAGRSLGALVPDRLMVLSGRELEVLVYPSDVAISGTPRALARARAAIASRLTDSPAYMTTSAEAQRIEDSIRDIADAASRPSGSERQTLVDRVRGLDARIASLVVPFEEWETTYRERLQIERDLLAQQFEVPDAAGTFPRGARMSRRASIGEWLVGGAGLALLAADVALLLERRFSRAGRD
jgi:hypothetical protein